MEVLADSSVWISHFRAPDPDLTGLLEQGQVLAHVFVIDEIACWNLKRRERVLADLNLLPASPVARHEEALRVMET